MRIFLRTSCSVSKAKDVAAALDAFDATFSARYLETDPAMPFWSSLESESHYEADKFSVFFLDVAEADKDRFVATFSPQDWCLTIAQADDAGQPVRPYFYDDSPDVSFMIRAMKPSFKM